MDGNQVVLIRTKLSLKHFISCFGKQAGGQMFWTQIDTARPLTFILRLCLQSQKYVLIIKLYDKMKTRTELETMFNFYIVTCEYHQKLFCWMWSDTNVKDCREKSTRISNHYPLSASRKPWQSTSGRHKRRTKVQCSYNTLWVATQHFYKR